MLLVIVAAVSPGAVAADGPAPASVAPWLEAHRRIEYRAIRPDPVVLATWIQEHREREERAAKLAGQLRRHVERENAD